MKTKIINFLMFITILVLIFIDTKNKYIFIALNIYIFIYTYFIIKDLITKKKEEKYIEERFKIVKKNLLNIEQLIILILKDGKVVWANDNAYLKFPNLKNSRSTDFLFDNLDGDLLKVNNRVYKALEENTQEDVFVFMEYTDTYRMQNKLSNIQTIIGQFQIDNLSAIKKMMDEIEYLEFMSSFEKKLYNLFFTNKIYFQKMSEDTYYLNFPYNYISQSLENRFKDLGDLIREFHEKGIEVTTTMGIAFNYTDIDQTGKKAKEAFELALSRGGGQIVVFEDEKKHYFGGGISSAKGSHRLRARIIGNTLSRILPGKEVVYLITHNHPDADAIASLLLMYEYLKQFDIEIKILIDTNKSIKKYGLNNMSMADRFMSDYVIDNTKKNILIALDTQSKDIVSHPEILDKLEEKIIIDHHQTPKNYFRGNIFSWIEPSASSTTELLVSILLAANIKVKDKLINTLAIYGILTDTNKLRYRTTYQTIDALMHLIEDGGDLDDAYSKFYLKKPKFKVKQEVLSKITYIEDFSYVEVDYEVENFLLSSIADEMLQIIDIKGSIAISKFDGDHNIYSIKVRTNGEINAKNLVEHFGGGGHYKQAAMIVSEQQKEEFLEIIKNKKY